MRPFLLLPALTCGLVLAAEAALSDSSGRDAAQSDLDCSVYREGDLVTRTIGAYDAPSATGGQMEIRRLTVRPEYIFQPSPTTDPNAPPDTSALFEVEIDSGQPPVEPERSSAFDRIHFVLLLNGWSYSRPDLRLGTLAASAVSEPQTAVGFEVVGPGYGDFQEIAVEGQADYVTREAQIYASLDDEGRATAIMKCNRPDAFPNPTCTLIEQVGEFDATATFRRVELPKLDLIRKRVHDFTQCLAPDR